MNISLRWLCDHLEAQSWNEINVEKLLFDFNTKVAEIEHAKTISHDISSFVAGRVVAAKKDKLELHVPEWEKTLTLAARSDCSNLAPSTAVLLRKSDEDVAFVTLKDCGLDKDGFLPPLDIADDALAGGWREQWEETDVIFDVDNKSITHRPDMWGHRGFAREIAALLNTTLVHHKEFLKNIPTEYSYAPIHAKEENCGLEVYTPTVCKTLAGLLFENVNRKACDVRTVSRFLKIGYRPINALVDVTNFVMADWGHPMHAYDADKVADRMLIARLAKKGEQLEILDGTVLTLTSKDIVIADKEKVLSLGGVMGGKHDSISDSTQSIILEAACFHAASVRRTAARYKLRTESSQRFEKTLDRFSPIDALERFIMVALKWGIITDIPPRKCIEVIGDMPKAGRIILSYEYVVKHLGFDIGLEKVKEILKKLDFLVRYFSEDMLEVGIPYFRAAKDITGQHDLVEEIARQYGFDNIEPVVPKLPARATNLYPILLTRQLKEYMAYSAGMHEQRNYAFYSEKVLRQLEWDIEGNLALKNPVSKEAYRLVTDLLPHLFNNVIENMPDHDRCDFFEWGTVWPDGAQSEHYQLAGVWYDKREGRDFYTIKEHIVGLCRRANVDVRFVKQDSCKTQPWLEVSRGAALYDGKTLIGYFGQVSAQMLQRMGALPESSAHAFVINGTYLQQKKRPEFSVGTLQRHQHSTFDVSVMVPLQATVADLESEVKTADDLIVNVRLIDFFEKKEWTDQRSIALRITLAHSERTVSREEIEQARQKVIAILEQHGGQLRA